MYHVTFSDLEAVLACVQDLLHYLPNTGLVLQIVKDKIYVVFGVCSLQFIWSRNIASKTMIPLWRRFGSEPRHKTCCFRLLHHLFLPLHATETCRPIMQVFVSSPFQRLLLVLLECCSSRICTHLSYCRQVLLCRLVRRTFFNLQQISMDLKIK